MSDTLLRLTVVGVGGGVGGKWGVNKIQHGRLSRFLKMYDFF